MAKIWKRHDRDCWVVDFRNHLGRRVRKSFDTRDEAEQELARKIQNNVESDILLSTFTEKWLQESTLEAKTLHSYKQILEGHILPAMGRLKIRDIKRRTIKDLLAQKRSTYSKNTVRLIRAVLSSILTDAVDDDGIIQTNPALGIGRKKKNKDSHSNSTPEIRPMDWEQLKAFNMALAERKKGGLLSPSYARVLSLLPKTGLRPSEAFALQIGDIDFRSRKLRVERALTMGGKIKGTKTEETRNVDINQELLKSLEDHVTWVRAEAIGKKWEEPLLLFPNEMGKPLDERNVRRAFSSALTEAKLPSFRVYDLRHTFASLLLSSGVPLLYVSQQLGHAKPTTTLKYYAHWIPRSGQSYVEILSSGPLWHQVGTKEEKSHSQTL